MGEDGWIGEAVGSGEHEFTGRGGLLESAECHLWVPIVVGELRGEHHVFRG